MSQDRLKILSLNSQSSETRLINNLENGACETVCLFDSPETINKVMNGDFDVALIDSHHSDAKSVCMALYKNRNIPVVLVIKKTEANWKNYLGWKVDGFVAEECGKIELMARIQAIIRRKRYLN